MFVTTIVNEVVSKIPQIANIKLVSYGANHRDDMAFKVEWFKVMWIKNSIPTLKKWMKETCTTVDKIEFLPGNFS
jgi:hypothetical protein